MARYFQINNPAGRESGGVFHVGLPTCRTNSSPNHRLQINGLQGKRDQESYGRDKKRCQGKIDAKVMHGESCPVNGMMQVDARARMHKSPLTMASQILMSSEIALPPTAKPARPRVAVRNVNVPEYVGSVDAIKYETMRKALLKVLPRTKPGLTQADMWQQVPAHLSQEEFPGGAKAGWWVKCVQLDLEAKGVITRDPAAKPLRWHRLK